ncbi:MAG: helix-turn-helix domain-containing protein [Halomonas sp.]|nr:helix-turn-helix domain-containing protein [Halomonas sp.]MDP3534347.1 helix-turn-helix domain-containing protein [Halomonas sp.]
MDHMLFFLSQAEQFPDQIDVMQTFAERHNIPFDRARIDQHIKARHDVKTPSRLPEHSPTHSPILSAETPGVSSHSTWERWQQTLRKRRHLHTPPGDDVMAAVTQRRKALGLTQVEFARRLGVSVRTYQEWEQGRRRPSGASEAMLHGVL